MNDRIARQLLDQALLGKITFPEVIATMTKEGVESYHVDFLRNECRYYLKNGESFVMSVAFKHNGVVHGFSAAVLDAINKRVQSGHAFYSDFVAEGPAAGCARYMVYVDGKKVRYFGRDGGEHIQLFPGSDSRVQEIRMEKTQ